MIPNFCGMKIPENLLRIAEGHISAKGYRGPVVSKTI